MRWTVYISMIVPNVLMTWTAYILMIVPMYGVRTWADIQLVKATELVIILKFSCTPPNY